MPRKPMYSSFGYKRKGRRLVRKGRKNFKRKKNYAISKNYITRWGSGHTAFPNIYRCKMRYTEERVQNTSVELPYVEMNYRANSVFDPNAIAGVTQTAAYEFGKLSAIYTYYRVYASAIKVKFGCSSTLGTTNRVGRAVIYGATDFAGVATMQDAIAQRNSKSINIVTYSTDKEMTIYMKRSIAEILGIKRKEVSLLPAFIGTQGTNPEQVAYWVVGYEADSGSVNNLDLAITIDYWVEWFLPRYTSTALITGDTGPSGPSIGPQEVLNGPTGQVGVTGSLGVGHEDIC